MERINIIKNKETGQEYLLGIDAYTKQETDDKLDNVAYIGEEEISADEVSIALEQVIENASKAEAAAISSAANTESIKQAIQNLPDGQAVSGQVAMNTAKLSELEGKVNGEIKGFNVFDAQNIFTIVGKKRDKITGDVVDYASSNVSPLIYLEYIRNANGDIVLSQGQFRGSSLGVAFFYDENEEYIGCDESSVTYSTTAFFPSSLVKEGAKYVSFLQFNASTEVKLTCNDKPKGISDNLSALSQKVDGIADEINDSLEELDNKVKDEFGQINGKIKGFNVFDATNIFTIVGNRRNKTTGELETYSSGKVSPMIYLDYVKNGNGDIEIVSGSFRSSGMGTAFFFDEDSKYIGCDDTTSTYSSANPFPASLIPINAVYVSLYQFNSTQDTILACNDKPLSIKDEIKDELGIIDTQVPEIVRPNMSISDFYKAYAAKLPNFAARNHTYIGSFFYYSDGIIGTKDKGNHWDWSEVLDLINKNFRADVVSPKMSKKTICKKVNEAFQSRILRFYDAKPLSDRERDASLTTGLNNGEPSVIVSDDGSTMSIYANGSIISTTDGVKWSEPIEIVKSDNGHTLHECVNYIDGVYYLIAPRRNEGGVLALYTSTDGINFTLKGNLFADVASNDVVLGADGYKILSWGNPYLIKEYSSNRFYLYIETQDYIDATHKTAQRIHLVIFDDLDTQNVDGTIGRRIIADNNPVLNMPFEKYSNAANGAGNPDFFKGMDNRPIKSNGRYFMQFHSTHLGIAHLFRASSIDLIHWDVDGLLWDNRDIPSGGDETSGNADACVVEFKGRSYLFYTHDINQVENGIEHIKYTIDDRPLCELLKLKP